MRMPSQPIWIGIVIAAFVVGLGSTYLIFHTGSSDVNADFNMMENNQHAQEMADMMNMDHNFTMEMMSAMIEDPALQLQMIGATGASANSRPSSTHVFSAPGPTRLRSLPNRVHRTLTTSSSSTCRFNYLGRSAARARSPVANLSGRATRVAT